MSSIIRVATLPPSAAERLSLAMHVCPTCGRIVKATQSVQCAGEVVYHATCFYRRVIQ